MIDNIAALCNLTLAIALTRQVVQLTNSEGAEELTVKKLGDAVLSRYDIEPEAVEAYDRRLYDFRVYRCLRRMKQAKIINLIERRTQLKTVYYTVELMKA